MSDRDPAIEKYYSLKPATYKTLESLTLRRVYDQTVSARFDLSIRLVSSLEPASKCLYLEFEGVRELRIGSIDQIRVHHLMVDIRSISDDQLENLNYRVVENEENAFSFVCNRFKATVELPTVN